MNGRLNSDIADPCHGSIVGQGDTNRVNTVGATKVHAPPWVVLGIGLRAGVVTLKGKASVTVECSTALICCDIGRDNARSSLALGRDADPCTIGSACQRGLTACHRRTWLTCNRCRVVDLVST